MTADLCAEEDAYLRIQDPVWKHSKTPLNDPNFDFEAWKTKHMASADEVAAKWVQNVKSEVWERRESPICLRGILVSHTSETRSSG